jgi:hypothetical protein
VGSSAQLGQTNPYSERLRADLTVPDLDAILSGVISMERNLSTEHQGIGLEIVIAGLTAGST